MSKTIKPSDLGKAIQQELELYRESVIERINAVSRTAIQRLVDLTKSTAPSASGSFKKNISFKETEAGHGMKKFIWYVKAPDYRLTHLLVHGHATKNGGRTKPDPFLDNALKQVLPVYEEDVKEALIE